MKILIVLTSIFMTSTSLYAECVPGSIDEKLAQEKALIDLIQNQDSIVRGGAQRFTNLPLNYCTRNEDGSYEISARIQRSYTYKGRIKRKLWAYKMVSNAACNDFNIIKIETRNGDALPSGCNGLYYTEAE